MKLPAILLTLLFATLAARAAHAAHAAKQPNIVFILADDLGWTDLAVQGSKYYETPNIDRLAAQGTRLTRYHNIKAPMPTPNTDIKPAKPGDAAESEKKKRKRDAN